MEKGGGKGRWKREVEKGGRIFEKGVKIETSRKEGETVGRRVYIDGWIGGFLVFPFRFLFLFFSWRWCLSAPPPPWMSAWYLRGAARHFRLAWHHSAWFGCWCCFRPGRLGSDWRLVPRPRALAAQHGVGSGRHCAGGGAAVHDDSGLGGRAEWVGGRPVYVWLYVCVCVFSLPPSPVVPVFPEASHSADSVDSELSLDDAALLRQRQGRRVLGCVALCVCVFFPLDLCFFRSRPRFRCYISLLRF